jgi:hypothetical protein
MQAFKTYNDHLLASCLTEGLGPSDLARVALLLECPVALAPAEPERLRAQTEAMKKDVTMACEQSERESQRKSKGVRG